MRFVQILFISRRLKVTPELLKKLQQTELNILSDFDAFCKEKNLQYYLIGGALLGAARYQGFIPWDDDIDVAMPRDDYEKLKEKWAMEPSSKYFLQSAETDSRFSRGIMKLRLNGTAITEQNSKNVKMHNGIYIDIFPIDYLPEYNPRKINAASKKIRAYLTMRSIKNGYTIGRYQFIKKILRKIFFFVSNERIDRQIYKLCTGYNKETHRYAVLFLHNYDWKHQIHDVEVFGNGALCTFEGNTFISPQKSDLFLSKVFGTDYMKEPDESKRFLPHKYIQIDFGEYDTNILHE